MNLQKEKKLDIVTGEYVKLQYHSADAGKRILATFIDWTAIIITSTLIYSYIVSPLYYNFSVRGSITTTIDLILAIFVSYADFFCEYLFNGRTLGKLIVKIRVVNSNGIPPNFLECFLRWLLMPIDFFVGIFVIAKYEKRLGDFASGCNVVYNFSAIEEDFNASKELLYLEDDYKVKYSQVSELSPEEVYSIQKVAYFKIYSSLAEEMCRRVKKKLNKTKFSENGRELLRRIVQDYNYITQIKNSEVKAG